jgi:hypothetical protein
LLSGLPSRPSYFSSSSFNPFPPLPRFDIDNLQVVYSLCEGAFTAISCSSASFYSALRLLLFFCLHLSTFKAVVAFYYRKQQIAAALHMDTKFYHLYNDNDISQAKNFLQSANISEGALGFSGGHGPLFTPLATGLTGQLHDVMLKSLCSF